MPVEWTVVCPRIKVKTLRKNSKVKWPCGSSSPPARVSLSLALPSACFGLKPEKISIKKSGIVSTPYTRRRLYPRRRVLGVVFSALYPRRCILGVVSLALYSRRCILGGLRCIISSASYSRRCILGVVFSALYPWRCILGGLRRIISSVSYPRRCILGVVSLALYFRRCILGGLAASYYILSVVSSASSASFNT